ncbi:site-2 protease family protein [Psychroserpens luteolus]|uniref:site-2 protease family protein n=1 Tax=Psychroserpens luteolus TaxID=2855840 RepID=UPI001E5C6F8A|nr:site-2 protease family protein [Psychroserpens luteolus]MCD2259615.1 site-2 protease family protein [Psychroserpens luteolus]
MNANLNLGSIFGIKIKIHWTFFFLIAWIVFDELKRGGNTQSVLFNIAFIIAVFICVVLHELGHALTAKRFGISTKKITLLPIGGMASLDKIPESPKQEFLVVIAGPSVNVVIALILYFIIPVKDYIHFNFTETFEALMSFTLQNFLFYLFIVNVGLILFNSIPAFPMDGGRILRAILALKMDRVKATQIAATIGQFIAGVFLLVGLLYNPFLVFIALFIFLGAYGENRMVQHLDLIKGHTVEEAMMINITLFNPKDSIDLVVNKIISGTENNFVVVDGDTVKGILYHKDIVENSNKTILVESVMDTSFKTVENTDSLKQIYHLIYTEKQRFLPVVKNGRLVGAIDAVNLNEYILLQSKLVY